MMVCFASYEFLCPVSFNHSATVFHSYHVCVIQPLISTCAAWHTFKSSSFCSVLNLIVLKKFLNIKTTLLSSL